MTTFQETNRKIFFHGLFSQEEDGDNMFEYLAANGLVVRRGGGTFEALAMDHSF